MKETLCRTNQPVYACEKTLVLNVKNLKRFTGSLMVFRPSITQSIKYMSHSLQNTKGNKCPQTHIHLLFSINNQSHFLAFKLTLPVISFLARIVKYEKRISHSLLATNV